MINDQEILDELKHHLDNCHLWANNDDVGELDGFSCISSTFEAVKQGNVGLALERWNDLSSPSKPELSQAAQNWRPHE